jgi:hypothetical protein
LKGNGLLFGLSIGDNLNDTGIFLGDLNGSGMSVENLHAENFVSNFIVLGFPLNDFNCDFLGTFTVAKLEFAFNFDVVNTRGGCVGTFIDLDSFVPN